MKSICKVVSIFIFVLFGTQKCFADDPIKIPNMEELELFSSFLKNVTLEELPFIKRFCIWQGASLAKRRKSSAKLCSLRLPSLLSYTDKIVPVDDRLREAFPGVRADVLQVLASVISQKDVQKLTEKIHSPIDPNKTKVDPHILAIQKYYPRIPLSVFQALGDVYSKNVKAPAPKILYRNLLEQVSEISLLLFPFERKLPNLEDLERRFVFPDGTNLMKVMANRTYICSMEIKYAERLESVFFAKERELSCFPGFTFYTKGVGSEKDVGKKRYGIVFYEKDVHFFEISNKTLKVEFLCTKKGAGMCYFSTKGLKDFHKIDVPGFMELRCFLGKLLTTGEKSSLSEKLLGGINKIFQGYISEDIEIFTGALKKVLLSIANEEIEEGDIASFGLKLNYACFLSTLFCPQLACFLPEGAPCKEILRYLNECFWEQYSLIQDACIKDNTFLLRNLDCLRKIVDIYFARLQKLNLSQSRLKLSKSF